MKSRPLVALPINWNHQIYASLATPAEAAALRTPRDRINGHLAGSAHSRLADGTGMTCGNVGAIGGIRPSSVFEMALHDPKHNLSLTHCYTVEVPPEVA